MPTDPAQIVADAATQISTSLQRLEAALAAFASSMAWTLRLAWVVTACTLCLLGSVVWQHATQDRAHAEALTALRVQTQALERLLRQP
jgi:hypothetical protein